MQYRPHRYLTEYPVELITPSGPQRVKITDVNTVGARIRGLQDLRRGQKIQFKFLSHRTEAIVRWVSGERAGLTFRPHITDLQVDMLRYRQDGRRDIEHGTVGFSYAEMR